MLTKMYGIAVTALVFSTTLLAAETYNGLDTDENGFLSLDEAQSNPVLASHWEILDLNGDGQIDEAEFAQFEVIGQERQGGIQEIPASDMPE